MFRSKNLIDDLMRKNEAVDWEIFLTRHQEYSPSFAYLIHSSISPKRWFVEKTNINFDFKYYRRVGDEFYWSTSRIQELKELLDKKGDKDPSFYLKFIKDQELYCEELNNFINEIKDQNYNNFSNREMTELYEKYWEKLRSAAAFMLVKHNLNRVLEKRIKNKLSLIAETKDAVPAYFDALLVPARDTLITKANKELLKLAIYKKLEDLRIYKWLRKYNWIETFTWIGKPLQKEDIISKIEKLKKENILHKNNKNESVMELTKKLEKYPDIVKEIKALQYLLYFHTFELETLFSAHYLLRNLIEEISSRIGLEFNDFPFAVYPEVIASLRGYKLDKTKILQRRNNQCTMFLFDEKIYVVEGELFLKLKNVTNVNNAQKKELKGNPAFQGLVKGRAILVKSVKDFKRLETESIIVTTMTTVEFTPYLNKVKGIVTDEGGITCHAAIISRELKIPCIIGTKFATQVLRDGDLVEVDGDAGVVRILKRVE